MKVIVIEKNDLERFNEYMSEYFTIIKTRKNHFFDVKEEIEIKNIKIPIKNKLTDLVNIQRDNILQRGEYAKKEIYSRKFNEQLTNEINLWEQLIIWIDDGDMYQSWEVFTTKKFMAGVLDAYSKYEKEREND